MVSYLALFAGVGQARADTAAGLWLTNKGKAKIKIESCGGDLCSKIVWLRDPNGKDGRPVKDHYNPDPTLKSRAVIGLATFSGLQKKSPGKWSGMIYNPEDGKTYTVQLVLVEDGMIRVNGCASGTMECGQREWHRVGR